MTFLIVKKVMLSRKLQSEVLGANIELTLGFLGAYCGVLCTDLRAGQQQKKLISLFHSGGIST